MIQFCLVLVEEEPSVCDAQVEHDSSILLKGEQVLKHISIIEQYFTTLIFGYKTLDTSFYVCSGCSH